MSGEGIEGVVTATPGAAGPSRVRRARPGDGPGIGAVHVAAWRAAYRGVVPDDLLDGLDPCERGESWRTSLAAAGSSPAEHPETFVVSDGAGEIAGFASVGPARAPLDPGDEGLGELWVINTAPHVWGSGAGRALHDRVVGRLAELGHSAAVLWVVERNARARRFYERLGWHPDGTARSEDIGGATVAEVRYRRRLGSVDRMWAEFTAATGHDGRHTSWAFGGDDDRELADELVRLVLAGTKRATTSLPSLFEDAGEDLPRPGDHSVVVDGRGVARCVIETTEVEVRPFAEVDARFAHDEGEGDRSLASWREMHLRFFASQGTTVEDTTAVVCERFALRWPPGDPLSGDASGDRAHEPDR